MRNVGYHYEARKMKYVHLQWLCHFAARKDCIHAYIHVGKNYRLNMMQETL
jgi:hypothetical protein